MRLVYFASVASLLLGGCTRDNPAFGQISSTGDETHAVTTGGDGDGDGAASSGSGSSEESGGDGDGEGDGDGDIPLPDCSEGSDWLTLYMDEDNFVQSGPFDQLGCVLGLGDDPGGGGLVPMEFGPIGVPCSELNFGHTDEYWLATSGEARTGYMGRVDLTGLTARGIQINSAHYKFGGEGEISSEVAFSLAPIREDQVDWWAGEGDGEQVIEEESTLVYRAAPYAWDGNDVFAVVDLTSLLSGVWNEGDTTFEIDVPFERVQAWFDQEGRIDPGFVLWNDVPAPFSFYLSSDEGPKPPTLWVDACLGPDGP
jgi:hypothetical protein